MIKERLVDVSHLGMHKDDEWITAQKACRKCFGTGIKGYRLTVPVKAPDWIKSTKNKKCPQHVVEGLREYQEKTQVLCQCLQLQKKEDK